MKINNVVLQSGIYEQLPGRGASFPLFITYGATVSTGLGSANDLNCYPYYPNKPISITGFSINVTVGVGGANSRILFFSDTNGLPDSKLYESSNIDCSTTGVKPISVNFSFEAGKTYWLSIHQSSASIGFTLIPVASMYAFARNTSTFPANPATGFQFNYSLGSVPSNLPTTGTPTSNLAPHILFGT